MNGRRVCHQCSACSRSRWRLSASRDGSLGANGAIAAALMWLTNFGLLEKGRMIEIEALYVSLTALAFICWLSWWKERRWLAWTVSGIFLGLGLLAKGPLHLFFFYAVVIAVLWQAGELKRLRSAPHFVGILIMARHFCSLGYPLPRNGSNRTCGERLVAAIYRASGGRRFQARLLAAQYSARDRLSASVGDSPAVCPLRADRKRTRPQTLPRACRLGVALPFLVVSLLPGALPRYTMPLLAPAIWLLAIFIREHALLWPKPLRKAITWTVVAALVPRC